MDDNKDIKNIIISSIEAIRKKLLDLSTRNRLLNFTHRRTNSIRIVDELPNQLYDNLLAGKEFTFIPVPEPRKEQLIEHGFLNINKNTGEIVELKKSPSAKEWAEYVGINSSFHLPESSEMKGAEEKHTDMKIQTLLYPYELENFLMKLRSNSKTAIEETGANILYLAFGFLEWFEDNNNEKSRLAPLILVPVKLEKGRLNKTTNIYEYKVEYTEEDIIPNLSLREKLKVDFSFSLPNLDENIKPEQYFIELQDKLKKSKPEWKIYRMATMAMFNFGKLLMYLDLDLKNWPKRKGILENPIIQRFLGSDFENKEHNNRNYQDEYEIDTIQNIDEEYPLIDDVDSSQHSALIDAINGKNLVIEGPPGTGKSQTITNIIATALYKGKTVLFVAEKLAALEVVKRRLDKAGLGTFCLELHSHKTQKRRVLEDISKRMLMEPIEDNGQLMNKQIERYKKFKSELKRYSAFITRSWKNTGKSIQDIIMLAVRTQRDIDINPRDLHPNGLTGHNFDYQKQITFADALRSYKNSFMDILPALVDSKSIKSHPWYGVENESLQSFDMDEVCTLLRDWQGALEKLLDLKTRYTKLLSINDSEYFDSMSNIKTLIEDLSKINNFLFSDLDILPLLKYLQDEARLNEFLDFISLFNKIRNSYENLLKIINPEALSGKMSIESFSEITERIYKIIKPTYTLGSILKISKQLREAYNQIQENMKIIQHIAVAIGGEKLIGFFEPTIVGIQRFIEFLMLYEPYDESIFKHRVVVLDNEEFDSSLDKLSFEINDLKTRIFAAAEKFYVEKITNLNRAKEIAKTIKEAGFLSFFNKSYRIAKREILGCCKYKTSFRKIKNHFFSLIDLLDSINAVNRNENYHRIFSNSFNGLDTPVRELKDLSEFYKKVIHKYGKSFGWHTFVGNFIFDMPLSQISEIKSLIHQGFLQSIIQNKSKLEECNDIFKDEEGFLGEHQTLVGEDSNIYCHTALLEDFLKNINELFNSHETSISEVYETVTRLADFNQYIDQWNKIKLPNELASFFQSLNIKSSTLSEKKLSQARELIMFNDILMNVKTNNLANYVYKLSSFEELNSLQNTLSKVCKTSNELLDKFQRKANLDLLKWGNESIKMTIAKNKQALINFDLLDKWVTFILYRNNLIQLGFQNLVKVVETGSISVEKIESAYNAGVYDLIAREIFTENPEFMQLYSGRAIEDLRTNFCECDKELKKTYQQIIFEKLSRKHIPEGHRGVLASDYTEKALLIKECAKQRQHIPIRQLVNRSGNALQALKSCFMMGPMSVAQYLEPGKLEFDLIIMDEASQIKPEDSLGVIARGKQAVIVGDPKQLPPTSFFEKTFSSEDEEDTVIEESESILDAALSVFDANPHRLRWHYRSQHESLIAFSNKFFYDSKLVAFPSPYSKADGYGIIFTRIQEGCFVNRRNIEEARVIAQAVKNHLIHNPSESLGVVAMNIEQKDEIEMQIELLSKDSITFQTALANNQKTNEPLFIKNLEDVQGDERDVIFISFTYGPEFKGGRVMQRFGPINSNVGWRRLNVLFTRSKKRMHIFSSMGQEDILVSEVSNRGVVALKSFLTYVSTGELIGVPTISNREPSNDFERAVINSLERCGFECIPQVGVAGYFIDIAVKDLYRPGNFLMGIEFDGATYHSSKSIRDRDRLRQEVLKRLGWKIRRIWSTDWFKNSNATLKPIIEELHKLQIMPRKEYIDTGEKKDLERKSFIISQDLEKVLREFDKDVIRKRFKNTPLTERLLSDNIIKQLVFMKPETISEFQQKIPSYLRLVINPDEESEFLDQVLQIIRDFVNTKNKEKIGQLEKQQKPKNEEQFLFEEIINSHRKYSITNTCSLCNRLSSVLYFKDYARENQQICICLKSNPNNPITGTIRVMTDKGVQFNKTGYPYYAYELMHNAWCNEQIKNDVK